MTLELVAFYVLAAVTLGSAALVVKAEDPFHAAIWTALSLLSIGGHYLLLRADFVAMMQILIYVGAVMVLVVFVIMLTRREEPI